MLAVPQPMFQERLVSLKWAVTGANVELDYTDRDVESRAVQIRDRVHIVEDLCASIVLAASTLCIGAIRCNA